MLLIIGETGKYYCGLRLLSCTCCNGYCGPTDGCNCTACQALDLEDKTRRDRFMARGKSSQTILNSWTWKQNVG